MSATYYIGSVPQTFFRRIARTKTFYVASAAVLGVFGDAVNQALETGVYLIAWKQVLGTAVASGLAIVIRDAMAKAELAANAGNQNVTNVVAVDKEQK